MNQVNLFMLIVLLGLSISAGAQSTDWRNTNNVTAVIPHENYVCQEYVVVAKNGDWVTVVTTGPGAESQLGQHIIVTISSDKGKTWSKPIDLERGGLDAPAASWALPYITSFGRIYAFYNYNGDNIKEFGGKKIQHTSELGWYCYKYSDDNGKTWSDRFRLPMRKTTVDFINKSNGEVQLFWGVSKPRTIGEGMIFAFTKMGQHPQDMGEGWLFKSDNINSEKDPNKLNWELLPDGEFGISETSLGITQEEHNIIVLSTGTLYCIFRTSEGYPAESYSYDGGHSWTRPEFARYANGSVIKNPRAIPRMFQCSNGKYLLWYHNNNTPGYLGFRNPAWLSGGIEKDNKISWSEPEILLYGVDTLQLDLWESAVQLDRGKLTNLSYPDLVEEDGKFWLVEGQGVGPEFGKVHPIDETLFTDLWNQGSVKAIAEKGLILDIKTISQPHNVRLQNLPNLYKDGAFTIDMWLDIEELIPGQVILDSRNLNGKGFYISVSPKRTIELTLNDGIMSHSWDTDPGIVKTGSRQHVVFVVDGAPNIISSIVNGVLCDGGRYRKRGFDWFDSKFSDINGSDLLKVVPDFNGSVKSLRIYNRYLRTSEAVANFLAGND